MKSPSITPSPSDPTQTTPQIQHPHAQPSVVSFTSISNPVTVYSSSAVIAKPASAIVANQPQQAPLALTTQPQNQSRPQTQNAINLAPQTTQSITLTTAPSTTGPTALVIIPQHTNQSATPSKTAIISTKTTANHQSTPTQIHAPITSSPNALGATTMVQASLSNRPPSTLPVVSMTTSTVTAKPEPIKLVCCLLDNGVRCDKIAGNASFSARIQKIVGTKKMNFALDPTVRHAYICDHHKAIITVAKKSTTIARDTKANARNYANNSAGNSLSNQANSNYNDLTPMKGQQMQHSQNLELMNSQHRFVNNHTGTINNIQMRQGNMNFDQYQSIHSNQVGSMDVMMAGNYDRAGGDIMPSGSSSGVDVDLQQLQVNTLRRYKRHFRVPTKPGLNKMQLAECLKSHFRTLPIIEKEAITYFVYIVKCYRNKLDHNPKTES